MELPTNPPYDEEEPRPWPGSPLRHSYLHDPEGRWEDGSHEYTGEEGLDDPDVSV